MQVAGGPVMNLGQSILLGAALVAFMPRDASAAPLRVAQLVQIPTERQLEQIDRDINPRTPPTTTKRKQTSAKSTAGARRRDTSTSASTRRGDRATVDAAADSDNTQMDRRARDIDQRVKRGICRTC